jgi:hypothetical protein
MRTDLVSWRPGGASSAASNRPEAHLLLERWLALAGALLATGLLIGFYWVVASLVQRAEQGREQARLSVARQVACSAFSSASSRELCASTTAAHVPPNAVLQASYEQPRTSLRKRAPTVGLH